MFSPFPLPSSQTQMSRAEKSKCTRLAGQQGNRRDRGRRTWSALEANREARGHTGWMWPHPGSGKQGWVPPSIREKKKVKIWLKFLTRHFAPFGENYRSSLGIFVFRSSLACACFQASSSPSCSPRVLRGLTFRIAAPAHLLSAW